MELRLIKNAYGVDPYDSKSEEYLDSKKEGQLLIAEVTAPRNYEFHKKYFALLNIAYKHWEPEELSTKHGKVEKSFEQFRADLTILAGYYDQVFRLDGSVRIIPKSISFGSMDEEEFRVFYNKVVDVIILKVLRNWTIEDIDKAIGGFL